MKEKAAFSEGAESHFSSGSSPPPSKSAWLLVFIARGKVFGTPFPPLGNHPGMSHIGHAQYTSPALSPTEPRTALPQNGFQPLCATSQNTINSCHLNGLLGQAWWITPVTPTLRMLRLDDCREANLG